MPNGHIGGALPGSMLRVSFEFFPPKTAAMEEQPWHAVKRLEPLAPQFVSVTYGAGGTTRERTHATVKRIVDETSLRPAAHLTCVGATRAISQYFFDVWTFLRFRDRCAKAGIKAPIIPGILPVTNFQQVVKFSRMCGASVPGWLAALFDGLDEDADTRRLVAATVAAEQVRRLQEHGVEDFHFYTLNRADLTYALCHILGMRPAAPARAAA